jgi:integrase/recombinase XerC
MSVLSSGHHGIRIREDQRGEETLRRAELVRLPPAERKSGFQRGGIRAESQAAPAPSPALLREDTARLVEEGPRGEEFHRDRAVLELLYGCGLRVAELAALEWEDVQLEERWIRVRGKWDKERMVPMGRIARDALLELPLPPSGERGGPLFPGEEGGKLSVRTVHRIVTRAARIVGLAGVTPHVLRHSFATHMLEGGASLRVLQELLGHESLVTTQKYLRITAEQMRRSYSAAHPRGGGADEHV